MRRLGALVLLLTLTACSGDSDSDQPNGGATPPQQSAPATAEALTLTVVLRDIDEPTALFPLEDQTCTSINPSEEVAAGESPTPMDITVSTVGGEELDMQAVPKTGGTSSEEAGCTWEITFEGLPSNEGYNVTLLGYDIGAGASASPGGTVELSF
ncbi:hypothetical protein NPS01_34710 [Nocardioides psychrotolerans]|uniref:Uncharacterized protein n=1 Tax=Nocardioides psychrotolerans TaxID=1005945 RepID=A0A1I3N9K7_9ACTN|nr:hypothetical protein [Nocardioides psychrotolerans]GEP39808.1 hypothetical protein NPS01_34710 [Nocardioides psychrotolerans]SFJ05640.1 hypothetical protein SAMN05216561_11753 [Nocardioides psychrotolerans]